MYEKEVAEVERLIEKQKQWRDRCINLIASENVMSHRARSQAGSDFAHRYTEGHPGERYYRGTSFIDEIENRLKYNLKILFECDHCEVRPISGTNANEAVFSRFVRPGDMVMVNSTPGGGHISHHKDGSLGKFTDNIVDFPMTEDGYHIDVERTIYLIEKVKPKILVVGKSLFLLPEPVQELSEVCRIHNVRIIYDGAHVLGLIAGKRFQDPLNAHDHPEGIRIGVQEMTRFGMGEEEMVRIAELIKECVIENKSVKEVNRFRSEYQEVKYSFDELVREKPELVEIKATNPGLALELSLLSGSTQR